MRRLLFLFFLFLNIAVQGQGNTPFFFGHNQTAASSCAYANQESCDLFDAITGEGGSLTTTEKNSYDAMVTSLKSAGFWTRIPSIYPFIGGTAASCKWNGRDVQNTDGAHRITWTGTLTYSNGVDPNGSTGYGNLHISPADIGQNSIAFHLYISEDVGEAAVDMGVQGQVTSVDNFNVIYTRYTNDNCYSKITEIGGYNVITGNTNAIGFYSVSRTGALSFDTYTPAGAQNAVEVSSAPTTNNFYIGAENVAGTAMGFASKKIGIVLLSDGFNSTDQASLQTIVGTFISANSR